MIIVSNALNGPAADPRSWTRVRLESEQVIFAAPMGFTGSTVRIWRAMGERGAAWWSRTLWIAGAVLVLIIA